MAERSNKTTTVGHYILLANPTAGSFCHAVAQRYRDAVVAEGQTAELCDINTWGFDPVLKDDYRPDRGRAASPWAKAELANLSACSVLVFVYPIWFGGPPAILKGYVDRVLGAGCDIGGFLHGEGQRALHGKALLTLTTSAASSDWLKRRGRLPSSRQGWELYLQTGFAMRDAGNLNVDHVGTDMEPAYAEVQLKRVEELARLAARCEAAFSSDAAGNPPRRAPS
jgi:NAD(P)H dehydrogenase (quinone)